jgi:hypothetical protein
VSLGDATGFARPRIDEQLLKFRAIELAVLVAVGEREALLHALIGPGLVIADEAVAVCIDADESAFQIRRKRKRPREDNCDDVGHSGSPASFAPAGATIR